MPADVFDRHAGVGLLKDGDDLGLGEPRLLHGNLLAGTCQKVLLLGTLRGGEAYAVTSVQLQGPVSLSFAEMPDLYILLLYPFLSPVGGALGTVVLALLYNFVARRVGRSG